MDAPQYNQMPRANAAFNKEFRMRARLLLICIGASLRCGLEPVTTSV